RRSATLGSRRRRSRSWWWGRVRSFLLRRDNEHRLVGQMQELVGGRAEDDSFERRLAEAADHDQPCVTRVGDVDQRLDAALGHQLLGDLDAATGRLAARLAQHALAELLDRFLVVGDLAAPDPGRRVAEDD